jgi:hypothetical protein
MCIENRRVVNIEVQCDVARKSASLSDPNPCYSIQCCHIHVVHAGCHLMRNSMLLRVLVRFNVGWKP